MDTMIKSALFASLFVLWTCLPFSVSEVNSCFDCIGKTDPFACNNIRQCGPNQKCFSTSYFLDSDPTQLWDFGCKDVSFCGLIDPNYGNINGKRNLFLDSLGLESLEHYTNSFEGRRREPRSRLRRLTSCNDCCNGEFCNRVPCDEESLKIQPKGLVCHSCDAVQDPAMCTKTERCIRGELCAVWALDNGLYDMGCKSKAVCDAQGNNLLFGKRNIESDFSSSESVLVDEPVLLDSNVLEEYKISQDKLAERLHNVSKRRVTVVLNSGCRQCCLDNLCAVNYCSKTNTLPPNAITVTIPTTTLPPLLVRVLPFLVSTFEGDNATFVCDVNGQPPLTVQYSRSFISNTTTIRIPSCDLQSTLHIVNKTCSFYFTKLSESGDVTCSVTDSFGQSRTASAKLQVEPYKNNLKPNTIPKDSDLFIGKTTVLECAMEGVPIPFYEWFRNDSGITTPVKNSAEFNITTSNVLSVLEITPGINSDIDGNYFCQGNNRYEILNIPFVVNTITQVYLVKSLSDTTIDKSRKNYTFSCSFQSYPPPSLKWRLITTSNQILTLSRNSSSTSLTQERLTTNTAIVTFDELNGNDVQYIKCTGDNGFYTNSTQAEIKLLEPPEIITPPKSYHVSYGQLVSVTCEAKGVPEPYISWNFLDTYDNPQILQGVDLKNDGKTLEVAHVRSPGKFVCYASNSLGSDSETFPVIVS